MQNGVAYGGKALSELVRKGQPELFDGSVEVRKATKQHLISLTVNL